MPSTDDRQAWLKFADWNEDGNLDVSELAIVIAAMLPVDENGIEQFVRETFDTDGDGVISDKELEEKVLPYLESHGGALTSSTPNSPAPVLSRSSSQAELLAWFKHWDADDSDSLDEVELRYALTACFYRAFGDEVDNETKQTLVENFISEATKGGKSVSKSEFLETLAPALQLNLPEELPIPTSDAVSLRLRLVASPVGTVHEVDLSRLSVVRDLRREAQTLLGTWLLPQLFAGGRRLTNDCELLQNVAGLRNGAAVQAVVAPAPGSRVLASALQRIRSRTGVVFFMMFLSWFLASSVSF